MFFPDKITVDPNTPFLIETFIACSLIRPCQRLTNQLLLDINDTLHKVHLKSHEGSEKVFSAFNGMLAYYTLSCCSLTPIFFFFLQKYAANWDITCQSVKSFSLFDLFVCCKAAYFNGITTFRSTSGSFAWQDGSISFTRYFYELNLLSCSKLSAVCLFHSSFLFESYYFSWFVVAIVLRKCKSFWSLGNW